MKKSMWLLSVLVIGIGAALTVTGKDEKSHDWPAYSGDKGATKYSSLDQINKDTVGKLQVAWRQSGVPAELKAYEGATHDSAPSAAIADIVAFFDRHPRK